MAKLTTTDVYGKLTAHSGIDVNNGLALKSIDKNGNNVNSTFSWNTNEGTIDVTLENGVTGQMFQEEHIYGQAIEPIANGQVVMFAGSSGTVLFRVANVSVSNYQPEWIIGIATQDFTTNQYGYVTWFGRVHQFQTSSSWNVGDILYVDPYNNGALTNSEPDAHNYKTQMAAVEKLATSSTSSDGVILVRPSLHMSNINEVTKEPTGFDAPENVIVTYNSSTRTVTLTGTFVGGFWQEKPVQGLVPGWVSPPHPSGITQPYFLWYDGTNYNWTTTVWPFSSLMICYVYADSSGPRFALRECHGLVPWQTHLEFHQTVGTYLYSGGDLSNYTIGNTGARQPDVSVTMVKDEDIISTEPLLNHTLENYMLFYNSGTGNATWTSSTDIVPLNAGVPRWNQFTGGNWILTNLPTTSYMSVFLFAVPASADTASQSYRYLWVTGQSYSSDLTSQQVLSVSSLNLSALGGALTEYIAIGKIIIYYQSTTTWYIAEVDKLTGTRIVQASAPAGNYLSSVNAVWPITGIGTIASPLGATTGQTGTSYLPYVDSNGNIAIGTTPISSTTQVSIKANAGTTKILSLNNNGGSEVYSIDTSGNTIIAGNLTVNGTTTTINSTTLTITDINIILGNATTPTDTTANGGGITLLGTTNKTIVWDNTNANWTSSENWNIATTDKSYKINNVSVLNSTTLGSSVVNSSLTSVGTLSSLTVSGNTTLSSMTSGSVLFAGTSGLIFQNNSQLFWDNTNNRLGIGTTSPSGTLHVKSITATANIIIDSTYSNAILSLNRVSNSLSYSSEIYMASAGTNDWAFGTSAGSAGSRDFSFYGYEKASNILTLQSSTGNVGIGTTSPGSKLDIYTTGNDSTSGIRLTSASGNLATLQATPNTGEGYLSLSGTAGVVLRGSGNSYILGNVGIGTNSPGYKLDILGDGVIQKLRNITTTSYCETQWHDDTGVATIVGSVGSAYSSADWSNSGYLYTQKTHLYIKSANASGDIKFFTGGYSVASNIRMTIDSSGNVGIGTPSPQEKVHTYGNVRIDDSSGNAGFKMAYDNSSKTLNFIYVGT